MTTGWLLSSEREALFVWGDIVHLHAIQFARPDVGLTVDVDGPEAIATRRRVMDIVATDHLRVAGMHVDFPAFGISSVQGKATPSCQRSGGLRHSTVPVEYCGQWRRSSGQQNV